MHARQFRQDAVCHPQQRINTFNGAGSVAAQKKGSGIETGTLT